MGREMERSGAKHLHRERERGRMKTEKRANNRGCWRCGWEALVVSLLFYSDSDVAVTLSS